MKKLTPYERGFLARKAGCMSGDYPEGLTEEETVEWTRGFMDRELGLRRILENDNSKFSIDPTGDM